MATLATTHVNPSHCYVPFQTVAVTLFMALPTLFWTGEPLRDPLLVEKDSNVYFDEHMEHGPHIEGPYRYKREAETKSKSPTVPQVLIKRGLEALKSLIKPDPNGEESDKTFQKRMLSPAMLQDWDIGETIRAMVCPQCLLEGFVFGGIFVSCGWNQLNTS